MKRWLILLSVGCLAFAGAANAAVQQGDTEIDALGGFMTQSMEGGGSSDIWFLMGGVGYFVTDNIKVSGQVLLANLDLGIDIDIDEDLDLGGSTTMWGFGVSGRYHFMPTNQWVPYVGGQVMWIDADITDGWLWGPVVGARYELNANNDFYAEYQYHRWQGDIGDGLEDGHALFAGIVHQFK